MNWEPSGNSPRSKDGFSTPEPPSPPTTEPLTAEPLETALTEGYLVLDVVSTGADTGQSLVRSHTAEQQRVTLEQTVSMAALVGWEHQMTVRGL